MDDRCELLCLDLDVAEGLRRRRIEPADAGQAAERAYALADATRLLLTSALGDAEELCVCDLAWIAERSQNLVSHHLKVLRRAGLVRSRRQGKMVMYALTDDGRSLLQAVVSPRIAVQA